MGWHPMRCEECKNLMLVKVYVPDRYFVDIQGAEPRYSDFRCKIGCKIENMG